MSKSEVVPNQLWVGRDECSTVGKLDINSLRRLGVAVIAFDSCHEAS